MFFKSGILQFKLLVFNRNFDAAQNNVPTHYLEYLKKLLTGIWAGNSNFFAQASVLAHCFEPHQTF